MPGITKTYLVFSARTNKINILRRIALKATREIKERYRRRRAIDCAVLDELEADTHPKVKAIGTALREALRGSVGNEEQAAITAIEKRRSELLNSSVEIPKIDFGAGGWSENRSKTEMEKGVESTATIGSIARASKPKFWALILYKLIRKLEPASILELGSCVGISAAYQAFAMKHNGSGRLVTLEGSPETARVAQETLDTLGLGESKVIVGRFQDTLKQQLESAQPIDFFFNDGHHDRDAVLEYFELSKPHLAEDAVVAFDDIDWSSGMAEAWKTIQDDNNVRMSLDLGAIGIVVMGSDHDHRYQLLL